MRQILIYPGQGRLLDRGVPEPSGLHHPRREEAVANARDAVREYIAALEADHLPVPPDHFEAMVVAV